jgi:hypothetical protein
VFPSATVQHSLEPLDHQPLAVLHFADIEVPQTGNENLQLANPKSKIPPILSLGRNSNRI